MKSPARLLPLGLSLAFGAILLSSCSALRSKSIPSGYVIQADTSSPDHRYGVMVPVLDADPDNPKNDVVELKTKKIITTIPGDFPAYDRNVNHLSRGEASWSEDGSLLLWQRGGKWSWSLISLVRIQDGKAKWQLDVVRAAEEEILKRTRKARPERYAAVRKETKRGESVYPDGLFVAVGVAGGEGETVSLPMAVEVDLSEDPKDLSSSPDQLRSHMDAVVQEDGSFVVKSFHLESRPDAGRHG